jgi:preprotein translocase subunit SecA
VIKSEVTRVVINVQIQSPEELEQASEQIEEGLAHLENVQYKHDEFAEGGEPVEQAEPARSNTAAAALAAMGGEAARWPACPRSAATTRARAVRARSSSSATAS